jgi:hypothetical protein
MKIRTTLCLTVLSALAVAPLALAKLTMTPQSLGQIEGTLKFCSDVNSKAEAKYKEFGKMLVQEATEEELKKARASSEYKEAYASITEQLGKVPKDKAVAACTDLVGKE